MNSKLKYRHHFQSNYGYTDFFENTWRVFTDHAIIRLDQYQRKTVNTLCFGFIRLFWSTQSTSSLWSSWFSLSLPSYSWRLGQWNCLRLRYNCEFYIYIHLVDKVYRFCYAVIENSRARNLLGMVYLCCFIWIYSLVLNCVLWVFFYHVVLCYYLLYSLITYCILYCNEWYNVVRHFIRIFSNLIWLNHTDMR